MWPRHGDAAPRSKLLQPICSRIWQHRYNSIQEKLVKTLRNRPNIDIQINKAFEDTGLRPNLIIKKNERNEIHIIDVAMPFDNNVNAFEMKK